MATIQQFLRGHADPAIRAAYAAIAPHSRRIIAEGRPGNFSRGMASALGTHGSVVVRENGDIAHLAHEGDNPTMADHVWSVVSPRNRAHAHELLADAPDSERLRAAWDEHGHMGQLLSGPMGLLKRLNLAAHLESKGIPGAEIARRGFASGWGGHRLATGRFIRSGTFRAYGHYELLHRPGDPEHGTHELQVQYSPHAHFGVSGDPQTIMDHIHDFPEEDRQHIIKALANG